MMAQVTRGPPHDTLDDAIPDDMPHDDDKWRKKTAVREERGRRDEGPPVSSGHIAVTGTTRHRLSLEAGGQARVSRSPRPELSVLAHGCRIRTARPRPMKTRAAA